MACLNFIGVTVFVLLPVLIKANFQNFTPTPVHGNYSQVMEFQLDWREEKIIWFETSKSLYPYRVSVWADVNTVPISTPIMVVVVQESQVTSWQVPLLVENSLKDGRLTFYNTSRTLCHTYMTEITAQRNITRGRLPIPIRQNFIITLTTALQRAQKVWVLVQEEQNFYIDMNKEYSVVVSPSQTIYYYYKFPMDNKTDSVMININSKDDVCLTVSIQDSYCPVFDLDKDITYEGKYQTINRKGGMTIRRKEYPSGFFLVLVAKADNYMCSQRNSVLPRIRPTKLIFENRTSIVNFKVVKSITGKGYSVASLITLGALFAFFVGALVIVMLFNCFGTISKKHDCVDAPSDDELIVQALTRTDRQTIIMQKELTLDFLARDPVKSTRRAYNYLWHILSIAIFYSIPVVQLVFTYQRVVNQTGDQDMCYYNFLCAHPALGLSDFNHIFSNVGYVITGVLFLLVVLLRHRKLPYNDVGIPVQYGIFYAMGIALIIEGVLSACYHICPSQSNYQFDTSFMYVMAVLCMIKLYQNRHPDINATAYATFTVLGVAIFLAMIGILNGSLAIWILFVFCYTILCVYVSFKIYFISFVFEGFKQFRNTIHEQGIQIDSLAPMRKARFCLLVVANLLNYGMLVGGMILYHTGFSDFGTFLLGLLMANAVVYCIFYTGMKLVYHERICFEAIIYGLLGIATWAAATVFFMDNATLWTVTPAESRHWNQECIWMGFYDKHDVWHLLSAPALYFSFMFLLSLDDDLIDKKRKEIVVF